MSQKGKLRRNNGKAGRKRASDQAELEPAALRWRCDPAELGFETTDEIAPLEGLVGQDRAERAIALSTSLHTDGFNLYVAGPVGTGRSTAVRAALESAAKEWDRPSDWCYLHNFEDPYRPIAVQLDAGLGQELRRDFERLVAAFRREVPRALESPEFQERSGAIMQRLNAVREGRFKELRAESERPGFDTQITSMGIVNAPLLSPGKPMSPEAFELLPDSKKAEIRVRGQELQQLTQDAVLDIRRLEREAREQLRQLERDSALFAVGHVFQELKAKYNRHPHLPAQIDAIQRDFLDHLDEFRPSDASETRPPGSPSTPASDRYRVNVLVAQTNTNGAPVIFEPNPTYYNLIGRIDYQASMGAMSTDFTLIKPGALHRANGGFLVVQLATYSPVRSPGTPSSAR